MPEKIKFAVIGCGHIGKRHAEMVRQNDESELVALADVKDSNSLDIHQFGVPFFSSLEALLCSDIEMDVIIIATPNGFHAEQGIKVLESGKHLVVEKPIALSARDAEALILKGSQKDRHVFSVMQNRYSPVSVWLKDLLESGMLGQIYMVQIDCYWNRDARYYCPGSWHGKKDFDGGTLFTQFSHFIDLMYWYFGDITNIQARFADFNHEHLTDFEDSGVICFDFVSGGMGSINYSTAVWGKNLESSITIIAENGSVKVGGQYMSKVEYCHIKDYEMPQLSTENPANDLGVCKSSSANHSLVIKNIVDVLRHKAPMSASASDGLKVVDIIERIYALKPEFSRQA